MRGLLRLAASLGIELEYLGAPSQVPAADSFNKRTRCIQPVPLRGCAQLDLSQLMSSSTLLLSKRFL